MKLPSSPFVVAVVQAAPVFMDREATIDKACELILEAGRNGARLVALPESFIPGYPDWVRTVPAGEQVVLNELYAEFLANAVTIPGDAFDKLCRTARRAKTHVVVGVSERNVEASGASLYNTLVYIDALGQILGKHRMLVTAGGEGLVWTQGDGSTLQVHNTPLGKLGGLVGWENYLPLARYALYAWGVQIYVAAVGARDDKWLASLSHIAREGGVFVLSPCSVLEKSDVPDRYAAMKRSYNEVDEWIHAGNSVIVNPAGEFIAGPVQGKEEILYAELDPEQLHGPKWMLDVAGHTARPDVFQLKVNREPWELVSRSGDTPVGQGFERANGRLRGI